MCASSTAARMTRREGSHLPVVIVISLLVLAAFGGVVWLAYNNGVARGHADSSASRGRRTDPAKEPPAHAGGAQTAQADQDLPTARRPRRRHAEADAALRRPRRRHAADARPRSSRPCATTARRQAAGSASRRPRQAAAPKRQSQRSLPPEAARAVRAGPANRRQSTPAPRNRLVAPRPVRLQASAPPAGAFVLQIGAYKSQSEADAAWKTYQASTPRCCPALRRTFRKPISATRAYGIVCA